MEMDDSHIQKRLDGMCDVAIFEKSSVDIELLERCINDENLRIVEYKVLFCRWISVCMRECKWNEGFKIQYEPPDTYCEPIHIQDIDR